MTKCASLQYGKQTIAMSVTNLPTTPDGHTVDNM